MTAACAAARLEVTCALSEVSRQVVAEVEAAEDEEGLLLLLLAEAAPTSLLASCRMSCPVKKCCGKN